VTPAVEWKGSPNFYPQTNVAKLFATLHWMVGTLRSTDQVFASSTRKASATYGVGPSGIHQYVAEKDYPFSDGNTYANQHTISIEHEGGYLDGNGNRVSPSRATLDNSAALLADISRRHGWGPLVWGKNVFPHNHWVATACPGSTDYAYIINKANELLGNGAPPLAGVGSGSASPLGWNASSWSTAQIQTALMQLGFDLGPTGADNDYGLFTTKAVRAFEEQQGLAVDVGIAGPQVVGRLAQLTGAPAPVAASNKLVVDGKEGTLTIKAEQRALGVDPDGKRGKITIGAEQLRTGAGHDGIDGPDTTRHLQQRLENLGFSVGPSGIDGRRGPDTIRALQRALNAGTF